MFIPECLMINFDKKVMIWVSTRTAPYKKTVQNDEMLIVVHFW